MKLLVYMESGHDLCSPCVDYEGPFSVFVCLQVFSLSVTEIGSIISLGAKDSCEFFHDPNKGRR